MDGQATVKDIVRGMRKNGVCHDPRHWDELCDKLEEAGEKSSASWTRIRILLQENGILLAALMEIATSDRDKATWGDAVAIANRAICSRNYLLLDPTQTKNNEKGDTDE